MFLNRRIKNQIEDKTYQLIEQVGEGRFGEVYKARNLEDNKIYAAKIILVEDKASFCKEELVHETLSKLNERCDYLIYLECSVFLHDLNKLCFITKYYENGSLRNQIEEKIRNKQVFDHKIVFEWIKSILNGIDFLHRNVIIHRDIKPENILIDDENDIKLADFGISTIVYTLTQKNTTYCGSLDYMSPEILNHEKYSFSTDIWSCGCVLFELLTLRVFRFIISNSNNESFQDNVPEKFIILLKK